MEKIFELYSRYKKQVVIVGIILLVLILSIASILFIRFKDKEEFVEKVSASEETFLEVNNEIDIPENMKINIKGAIINPGVYELEVGSRVIDAINISGGLKKDADTSILNLSKRLKDEDVIIIYTSDEVKQIKEGNVVIEYIENECNCPDVKNSACIDPDNFANNNESKNEENISSKISINIATIEELQTLTGIGKSKAEDIIEYRNTNGNFQKIEDIKNVKGIGDSVFEKIKDNITV